MMRRLLYPENDILGDSNSKYLYSMRYH